MSQDAQVALALPRLVRPAAQRRVEQALVAREGALRLPALAVDPLVPAALRPLAEAPPHLPPVAGPGPLAALAPPVERDDRGADAQALPAQPVVLLAIEGRVGQQAVPGHSQRRLPHGRPQLRRVVAGGRADGGGGEEVAAGVADDGELGPQPGAVLAAGALEEVLRSVAALQAGGVEGRLGLGANQAALAGARGGLEEEQDELPFFRSRLAA